MTTTRLPHRVICVLFTQFAIIFDMMGKYKYPRIVEIKDELLKIMMGKILRRELRK
jgi:acyl-CoA synthetase (AMP-forming)/AMP-acid ligase II